MNGTIHLEQLEIGYFESKQFKTLSNPTSLDIYSGELIAIVGANGTGKSTLLRTLAGEQKKKGEIYVLNKKLEDYNVRALSQTLSFISTRYNIQHYTTVLDVISKGRTIYLPWTGILSKEDKQIVLEKAQVLGINHLLYRPFNTLSDGEKQRCIMAMSLAQDTPIILLDEPTAYIDFPNKYLIGSLLQDIAHQQNKCILFSSHDIEVVLSFADKILLLGEKEISLILPNEILKAENIKKLYAQTPIPDNIKELITSHLKKYTII